uniref:trypsin n=1 Tax=Cyprinus carpio TaxID=7962 RepID=A0A8C1JLK2_CYPCA
MTTISLLLLASLLPHLTFTGETDYITAYYINWYLLNKLTNSLLFLSAHVDVGIVNGTEAKPHSRPFMVSLQKNWRHICGGFLISDRFVMTAAHCWNSNHNIIIKKTFYNDGIVHNTVVGAHDLRQNEGSVRIGVKSYHMHPDFNKCTFENDIMLLRVTVAPMIVFKRFRDIEADSVCRVAGWGRLNFEGKKSFRLMEAEVKIMNNTECKNKWKDNFSASQMMCEDGGGPLVCGDTAVGVTSFGDPKICNSRERPEVYIKISPYIEWICKPDSTTYLIVQYSQRCY